MSLAGDRRVSVSIACLRGDRVCVGLELVDRGLADEVHVDYFPAAPPGAHSLTAYEVRVAAASGADSTIHLWGDARALDVLDLTPRPGLRVVVEQNDVSDLDSVERMRAHGWDVGWSIAASTWRSSLSRVISAQRVPEHVQVVSTHTPGFVGGAFVESTRDAVRWFAGHGASVSMDGGLTAAIVAGVPQVDTVVLGTNALGEAVSSLTAMEDLILAARATWLRGFVREPDAT